MAVKIPENLQDLFKRPIVCALATLMPNGQPQVTPVWFDYDGEYFIINTARGRQKDRNMKKGAKVTALIIDPQNPHHWAEVRGEVAEEDEAGALENFMALGRKYTGKAEYRPLNPGEVRVIYKIAIKKINGG